MKTPSNNVHSTLKPAALVLGAALLLSSTPDVRVNAFSTTTTTSTSLSLQIRNIQPTISSSLNALPSPSDPSTSASSSNAGENSAEESTTALSSTAGEYMPEMMKPSGIVNQAAEAVSSAVGPSSAQETTITKASIHDTNQWTKQNLAIALPALMGLLADPVLSMVDTGFVGRSGPINLAALGVCTSIFHMAFTVFRASTVATTSLVGSAETEEEKRQITKLSLQFAGVLGTLVLVGLRVGGPRALATMGVSRSSELFKPACDYLFARCWAAPAVVGRK